MTTTDGYIYSWYSDTVNNIDQTRSYFTLHLPYSTNNLPAVWLFQDLRRVREYFNNNTNPPTDPGYLSVHWVKDSNFEIIPNSHFWGTFDHPHVFIADDDRFSNDTAIHELGHHILYNITNHWFWYEFGCLEHMEFSQETPTCAWSEGLADFLALIVNNDHCYDFDLGPCTGLPNIRHYDIENRNRNDPDIGGSWWGDNVEGRVAGALYDLKDPNNEDPWYDTAYWGFDIINDIALTNPGQLSIREFWEDPRIPDRHNGVRSIYQNTIDYDQAPLISEIPELRILQNFPQSHIINLWDYSNDYESNDNQLVFEIVYTTDSRCGVSMEWHWVNANPQINWIGSCFVVLSVSDSIKETTASFWIDVVPITSRIYLPILLK